MNPNTLVLKRSVVPVIAGVVIVAGWMVFSKNKDKESGGSSVQLNSSAEGAASSSSRNQNAGTGLSPGPEKDSKTAGTQAPTLQDYQAKMREALQIKNSEKRTEECFVLIKEMCMAGYTEEAWSAIVAETGSVRTYEITAFFKYAELDGKQLETKMRDLLDNGYKGETSTALLGYLERFDANGLEKLIDSPEFTSLNSFLSANPSADPKQAYQRSFGRLAQETQDPKKQQKLWELAKKFRDRNLVDDNAFSSMVATCEFVDSFERFGTLPPSEASPDGRVQPSQDRKRIVDMMIREDAARTVQILLASTDTQSGGDMMSALTEWTRIEPKAAYDWYAKNSPSMSENQQTGAAIAFYESAYNSGEFDTAGQWANQIKDDKLRKMALERLQERE